MGREFRDYRMTSPLEQVLHDAIAEVENRMGMHSTDTLSLALSHFLN
jgi:hypothetical protein